MNINLSKLAQLPARQHHETRILLRKWNFMRAKAQLVLCNMIYSIRIPICLSLWKQWIIKHVILLRNLKK